MLNGFGGAGEIETLRAGLAEEFAVEVALLRRDISKAEAIDEMIATRGRRARAGRRARQQCRHPARRADRGIPGREVERDPGDQPVGRVSHDPRRRAVDEERKRGRIINVASAHALVASPFKSAYVSAKHGIAGLTKTVALEVAEDNITVNAICPGYVLTPLVEKQIPDTAKARGISEEAVVRDVLLAAQPTKRFVTVEEVAALAVFLAGDSAASITGAIIPIDGGWTAH